jgi:hypothetical protein
MKVIVDDGAVDAGRYVKVGIGYIDEDARVRETAPEWID